MRRVFIGQPFDHQIEPESDHAARHATARKGSVDVNVVRPRVSCLVARSFNIPFAMCLESGDYDYFGLLHADVAAPDGWLDILLDEMERIRADVIHAPAAIKNTVGVTTTAVAYSDDEWAPVRRITTTELQQLPITFDVETLRDCYDEAILRLLPNTGCILMRLGDWINDFPGFNVMDRLGYVDGKRVAQTVSEDWNFGHWADRNGLKVAGTRAVPIDHFGRASYPSNRAWGAPVDEEFMKTRELAVA